MNKLIKMNALRNQSIDQAPHQCLNIETGLSYKLMLISHCGQET